MKKFIHLRPTLVFILICSTYFFHKSWWTLLPFNPGYYPEAEMIGFVQRYLDGEPFVYMRLYVVYHGLIAHSFHWLVKLLGYPMDFYYSILLLSRLISAALALLSIIFLYDITEKIFGKWAALSSCSFLIFSPIFAVYCQTGIHHFHSLFFAVLAYYFLILFLNEQDEKFILKRSVGLGAGTALFCTSNAYGIIFPLLFISALFLKFYRKPFAFKNCSIALGSFFLVFAITNSYIFTDPKLYFQYILYFFNANVSQEGQKLWKQIYDFFLLLIPHSFGWGVFLFFIIGLISLAIGAFKEKIERVQLGITLVYLFPAMLGGIGFSLSRPILIAPLVAIAAGLGVKSFIKKLIRVPIGFKIALISFALGWQVIYTWNWLNFKTEPTQFDHALSWLVKNKLTEKHKNKIPFILFHSEEGHNLSDIYQKLNTHIPLELQSWGFLDEQAADIQRFLRIPFDYCIYDNADLFGIGVDQRKARFRDEFMRELKKGNQLSLLEIFQPKNSLFGMKIKSLNNQPNVSIFPYSRTFLIKNNLSSQKILLKESIQTIPDGQQAALIHTHSTYSHNGILSLKTIAQKLNEFGIALWIPTDTLYRHWFYQFGPFKQLLEQTSVLKAGIDSYLDELKSLENIYPNLRIIPGVEITPHYYWTGNPVSSNLLLKDGSKHMLIFGLENKGDYEALPIPEFNKMNKDEGEAPYQKWIDSVINKNALIFWAHPYSQDTIFPVGTYLTQYQTLPYNQSLLATRNYHGFAVLDEGLQLAEPGGTWDILLQEVCQGIRNPVYTIGEFQYGRVGKSSLKEEPYVFTILMNKEKNKQKILESLKEGKSYSVRSSVKGNFMWLKEFSAKKLVGDQFQLTWSVKSEKKYTRTVVIHNGKIVGDFQHEDSFKMSKNFPLDQKSFCSYIRLMIYDDLDGLIISNPIFLGEVRKNRNFTIN